MTLNSLPLDGGGLGWGCTGCAGSAVRHFGGKMRWVVEYDRRAAVRFVRGVGHPEAFAVAAIRHAAVLRVERDGRTYGYFWFVWTGPAEMALYACVARSSRGRWSRRDLGDLHKFPQFLGARRLIARPPDGRIAGVLRAAGWEARPGGVYGIDLPTKWSAAYGRFVSDHLSTATD